MAEPIVNQPNDETRVIRPRISFSSETNPPRPPIKPQANPFTDPANVVKPTPNPSQVVTADNPARSVTKNQPPQTNTVNPKKPRKEKPPYKLTTMEINERILQCFIAVLCPLASIILVRGFTVDILWLFAANFLLLYIGGVVYCFYCIFHTDAYYCPLLTRNSSLTRKQREEINRQRREQREEAKEQERRDKITRKLAAEQGNVVVPPTAGQ